ncbi:helix-turn-helix domain-containing protein [Gordonia paraffinivorans]|uniref:helix-turn-helix domain-containing protein n=1 Tax=Gordonia paraffinivorans TaxID=175628 RepID=UPI001B3580A1|nr:helix-turn-helix transcriptional regulator [Gordonia paraffinivorans]
MAQANDDGFGAVLRRLRRSRNLTQEELAERAQISAKAVSALERGERRRPTRTPSERWPARSSSTPPSAPDSAHRFPTRRRPPRRAREVVRQHAGDRTRRL